ncbi:MAG: multiheme c-type cytochrome [Gemmatimonadota bacterium]
MPPLKSFRYRQLRQPRRRLAAGLAGLGTLGLAGAYALLAQEPADFSDSPFLRIDPDRVVVENAKGYEPCGVCHTDEWEVWQETKHAQGYETLHKDENAKAILQRMNLRVTKRQEAVCMRCHYTVGPDRKAVAGVSCESCHGPAQGWLNVHNKLPSSGDESAAAREQRIAAAAAEGMLPPSADIYAVVANCFECHTVPQEELVNRGEHRTGTTDFDLVARVEQVRHNFLHGTEGVNRELTPERNRMMFVTGRILAYEYALRGLAGATAEGRYARSMERAAQGAYRALEEVATVASVPAVEEVLRTGKDLRLVASNRAELETAAERIRGIGQQFARSADAAVLAVLDTVIAGAPVVAPVAAATGSVGSGTTVEPSAGPGGDGGTAPAAPGASPPAVTPPPDMPGEIRRQPAWHSPAQNGTVGVGECASCHGEAEEWWYGDPHQQTGRRLLGDDPRARKIATLYGIGPAAMGRGDQICMSCHGTVDERSMRVVEPGVSCESCHGAGAAFLEPHQEGGNPQAGMRALKKADERARTCAGCHHVSDERLLAAGHPSGSGYDIGTANRSIAHWPGKKPQLERGKRGAAYPEVAEGALNAAFTSAVADRPIPQVEVVEPLPPSRPLTAVGSSPGGSTGGSAGFAAPPPMPGMAPARTVSGSLDLEPIDVAPGSMTPEEVLLLVKQRLERIYAAIGRGN